MKSDDARRLPGRIHLTTKPAADTIHTNQRTWETWRPLLGRWLARFALSRSGGRLLRGPPLSNLVRRSEWCRCQASFNNRLTQSREGAKTAFSEQVGDLGLSDGLTCPFSDRDRQSPDWSLF